MAHLNDTKRGRWSIATAAAVLALSTVAVTDAVGVDPAPSTDDTTSYAPNGQPAPPPTATAPAPHNASGSDLAPAQGEAAEAEATMRQLLRGLVTKRYALDRARQKFGEDHRSVSDAKRDVERQRQLITTCASRFGERPVEPRQGVTRPRVPTTQAGECERDIPEYDVEKGTWKRGHWASPRMVGAPQ